MRGDEGGEEGVEENGQEQWEGKVKESSFLTFYGFIFIFTINIAPGEGGD